MNILRNIVVLVLMQAHLSLSKKENSKEAHNVCDRSHGISKLICICELAERSETNTAIKASCMIFDGLLPGFDPIWWGFDQLTSLRTLTISVRSDGFLDYVPINAFTHLRSLQKIHFKHASITSIMRDAFTNMSSLQSIDLKNNKVKVLHPFSFSNLQNLATLSLDENHITEIKRQVFNELPRLEDLSISDNNITIIHDKAFKDLNNLKHLDLKRNSIFVLTRETFQGLEHLKHLDLSNNKIDMIGDHTFAITVSLEELHLDNNDIKMITDDGLYGLSKLRKLSVAGNKLLQLEVPVFRRTHSLTWLNLDRNSLKNLTFSVIRPIYKNFHDSSSFLSLRDNALQCDCNLLWLIDLFESTHSNETKYAIDNLDCLMDKKKIDEITLENEEIDPTLDYVDEIEDSGNRDTNSKDFMYLLDIPKDMIPCDVKTLPVFTHTTTTLRTTSEKIMTSTRPNQSTLPARRVIHFTTTNPIPKSQPTIQATIPSTIQPTTKISTENLLIPSIQSSTKSPQIINERTTNSSPTVNQSQTTSPILLEETTVKAIPPSKVNINLLQVTEATQHLTTVESISIGKQNLTSRVGHDWTGHHKLYREKNELENQLFLTGSPTYSLRLTNETTTESIIGPTNITQNIAQTLPNLVIVDPITKTENNLTFEKLDNMPGYDNIQTNKNEQQNSRTQKASPKYSFLSTNSPTTTTTESIKRAKSNTNLSKHANLNLTSVNPISTTRKPFISNVINNDLPNYHKIYSNRDKLRQLILPTTEIVPKLWPIDDDESQTPVPNTRITTKRVEIPKEPITVSKNTANSKLSSTLDTESMSGDVAETTNFTKYEVPSSTSKPERFHKIDEDGTNIPAVRERIKLSEGNPNSLSGSKSNFPKSVLIFSLFSFQVLVRFTT